MTDQEKRRRTRTPVHFETGIFLEDEIVREEILNISLNGMLCRSHPRFRENDPCRVVITLSEEARIAIDAKIARVGGEETAIRFVRMDDESFVHLKRLVQYNLGDADRVDAEFRTQAFD